MKLRSSNFLNMLIISSAIHGGLGFFMFVPGADKVDQKKQPLRVQVTSFDSISFENSAPSISEAEVLDLSPRPQPRMQPITQKKVVEQTSQLAMLRPEVIESTERKKEPQVQDVLEKTPELDADTEELTEKSVQSMQSLPVNAPLNNDALTATYENIVVAWLERSKRYPDRAIRRGIEGEALLTLRISNTGDVLAFNVEDSSGFSILDEEVRRMVQRASPFPPMPENLSTRELSFSIPIAFRLE